MQFFFEHAAYAAEVHLYQQPALAGIMPPLCEHSDNADGSLRAPSGFVLPPFIVGALIPSLCVLRVE